MSLGIIKGFKQVPGGAVFFNVLLDVSEQGTKYPRSVHVLSYGGCEPGVA
jgi:hypothetical protein